MSGVSDGDSKSRFEMAGPARHLPSVFVRTPSDLPIRLRPLSWCSRGWSAASPPALRRWPRTGTFNFGPSPPTLDLNGLSKMGVKLVGRFAGVNGHKAQFSGSLANVCALADLKMNRLLNTVDEWALEHDLDDPVGPVERFELTRVAASPPLSIDLDSGEIRTVIWATGFHPDYSWLDVPVLDRKGRIRHEAGVVDSPGMYLMGLNFLRRRKSSFIHGAGDDARDLSDHLLGYLGATR